MKQHQARLELDGDADLEGREQSKSPDSVCSMHIVQVKDYSLFLQLEACYPLMLMT